MKKNHCKKIIAFIMTLMLLLGAFTSCGGGDSDGSSIDSTKGTVAALAGGDQQEQTLMETDQETQGQSSTAAANAETQATTADSNVQDMNGESGGAGGKSSGQLDSDSKQDSNASVCYVSVDGYCTDKKVKVSSSDNAYTVLKKTGARVSARDSQYGKYVEGINGLFEFDKGSESGWMYSVNGEVPQVSADKFSVSKGDKVKWYYVTSFE